MLFKKRYFQLSRADIGYFRFILESYDGLAFLRTLDSRAGLVEVAFPPSRRDDVERLLEALGDEFPLEEVIPENVPPL